MTIPERSMVIDIVQRGEIDELMLLLTSVAMNEAVAHDDDLRASRWDRAAEKFHALYNWTKRQLC